jgi:hypothetical protein
MSEIHPQPGTEHHLDRHQGHEAAAAAEQAAPTSVEPVTPQDTHAAGAASSEQHDLLHSNVSGSEQEGAAEQAKKMEEQGHTSAGYHSTGSSTGTTGGQS